MRESEPLVLPAASLDAMRAAGIALAEGIRTIDAPLVIALEGELGAGKTTLVARLLNALGFSGHARSPTYTLIEPYELAGRSIFHLDLYRLVDPREVEALGLRDLLQPRTVLLIEWPEMGAGSLPSIDVSIAIKYADSDEGRVLTIRGISEEGRTLLAKVASATKP